MPPLTLGPETLCPLVLQQEWKQAVAELMLWMEEKWPMVADEPSQACSSIRQKLKWQEIAERELLATRGYMEDLQQVRILDSRCRALFRFPAYTALPVSIEHTC